MNTGRYTPCVIFPVSSHAAHPRPPHSGHLAFLCDHGNLNPLPLDPRSMSPNTAQSMTSFQSTPDFAVYNTTRMCSRKANADSWFTTNPGQLRWTPVLYVQSPTFLGSATDTKQRCPP